MFSISFGVWPKWLFEAFSYQPGGWSSVKLLGFTCLNWSALPHSYRSKVFYWFFHSRAWACCWYVAGYKNNAYTEFHSTLSTFIPIGHCVIVWIQELPSKSVFRGHVQSTLQLRGGRGFRFCNVATIMIENGGHINIARKDHLWYPWNWIFKTCFIAWILNVLYMGPIWLHPKTYYVLRWKVIVALEGGGLWIAT